MSEWISIDSNQKPSGRESILVLVSYVRFGEHEDGTQGERSGQDVNLGEYVPEHDGLPGYFDSYSHTHGDQWWVTHWMPLPKPAGVTP